MALPCPNYFDEFERIRTLAQPYDAATDYSTIISQLKDACREFPDYLAVAPQNLVHPAELLPVIVIRDGTQLREFINPRIIRQRGRREQIEACANISLVRKGRKIHPIVLTERPTHIVLSYFQSNGEEKTETFRDMMPPPSLAQSIVGAVCHELDHLQGKLIVDFARKRLVVLLELLAKMDEESPDLVRSTRRLMHSRMPVVLLREGDRYVLRHGSDLEGDVPPSSPDAMFVDAFYRSVKEIQETFVPRAGNFLPIRPSRKMTTLLQKKM